MELKTETKINKTSDIKQYQKEYYLNKNKINLLSLTICCKCNKSLLKCNLSRHNKIKHTN